MSAPQDYYYWWQAKPPAITIHTCSVYSGPWTHSHECPGKDAPRVVGFIAPPISLPPKIEAPAAPVRCDCGLAHGIHASTCEAA